jgi:colanic acid biosynthesis glycosyl transferase WcaI
MRGQRLLLLSQWFDPEPTIKGLEFARGLAARGYAVEAVTGFPNYPGGKVYPGYTIRPLRRETIDGINVTRVPLYPSHGSSNVGRALNYLSFALSAALYLLLCRRPAVIYVYHPPITAAAIACIIGKLRGVPVVVDIQDLWPDTLSATGMGDAPVLLKLIGWACDFVYERAAAITVLSPGFRNALINRGVDDAKISVISNWAPAEPVLLDQPSEPPVGRVGRPMTILFAGNIGKAQGLHNLIHAATLIDPAVAKFVLLGGGLEVENLKAHARRCKLTNVEFLPKVSFEEAQAVQKSADCLLIHLRSDPLFSITIPSKTQSYLLAGKPIIQVGEGDVSDIVQMSGAGIVVSPNNPTELAKAVVELSRKSEDELSSMGAAGRAYYQRNFRRDDIIDRFAKVFERAIEHSPKTLSEAG